MTQTLKNNRSKVIKKKLTINNKKSKIYNNKTKINNNKSKIYNNKTKINYNNYKDNYYKHNNMLGGSNLINFIKVLEQLSKIVKNKGNK